MSSSAQLRSGKGSRDENFPVASWLIRRRNRPVILAFYEFVRVADDIADHPSLGNNEKLARLARLEASLLGDGGDEPEGLALGVLLRERGLATRHAQDLLKAFRQDVTKLRYANWAELIDYCSLSAMPVGRFVLDVHGEDRSTWPANDALCAALQIINHLQDCKDDYRDLDRVYIPLETLAAHGASVEALGELHASPALLAALHGLAERTETLLAESDVFPLLISDRRLALEVSVINTLAHRLTRILKTRDPLGDRVHLSMPAVAGVTLAGIVGGLFRRLSPSAAAHKPRGA
jgi:squalene synthase HpnC